MYGGKPLQNFASYTVLRGQRAITRVSVNDVHVSLYYFQIIFSPASWSIKQYRTTFYPLKEKCQNSRLSEKWPHNIVSEFFPSVHFRRTARRSTTGGKLDLLTITMGFNYASVNNFLHISLSGKTRIKQRKEHAYLIFTAFPQISYCGFFAPITPATTGPILKPVTTTCQVDDHQQVIVNFTYP